MCKKISSFSDEVRCGVALTIPQVLTAIATDHENNLPTHLLPYYTIHVYNSDHEICGITHPFFVPEILANRGKKRVYCNGQDGIKITYAYRHDINKLMKSLMQSEIVDRSSVNRLADTLAERWIITKGYPKFKNWNAFIGQLVGVQSEASRSNHPCCDLEKYDTTMDIINKCPDIPYKPGAVRCLHHGYRRITLTKYKI